MITEQTLNAFFDSKLLIWAPLAVLAFSATVLRRQNFAVIVISPLIFALSLWFFIQSAGISWAWRDGLGQDAVENHGAIAVSRFMENCWSLVAFSAFMFSLGFVPILVSKFLGNLKRQHKQANS